MAADVHVDVLMGDSECPICFAAMSASETMAWPSCGHVAHTMHLRCGVRHAPLARGLSHFRASGGDVSRIQAATCPMCNQRWGEDQHATESIVGLLVDVERLGVQMPERGCPCGACRAANVGPDETPDPYSVGPVQGELRPHATVYCCSRAMMRWHTNRSQSGWSAFWQCDICSAQVPSDAVQLPPGPVPRCENCHRDGCQWTVHRSPDSNSLGSGQWFCT